MSGPFSSVFKEVIFNSQLQFFLPATQHTAHVKILNLEVIYVYDAELPIGQTTKNPFLNRSQSYAIQLGVPS